MNTAENTTNERPLSCEIVLTAKQRRNFDKKFVKRESGCWEWTGFVSNLGYGRFQIGRIQHFSHRLSYAINKGPITGWLFVCHSCDNRLCVNPDHLWLGTHSDNMQDMLRKGRGPTGDKHGLRLHPERRAFGDRNGSRLYPERLKRGENHHSVLRPECVARGDRHGSRTSPGRLPRGEQNSMSKLTWDKVAKIRELYSGGILYQRDLANMFSVSQHAICAVVGNKTWKI